MQRLGFNPPNHTIATPMGILENEAFTRERLYKFVDGNEDGNNAIR